MSVSELVFVVITKLPTLACVASAAWLASNNKDGWGWFLFVAVLVTSSVKIDD